MHGFSRGLFLVVGLVWLLSGCGGGGGGTTTNPQNPTPTLTSVSPSSAAAGSAALTITATGSNFISSSSVRWNGAALSTTFVSATSLQASVPASALASAGTASVTVQTPTPGGGASGAVTFTVNPLSNPAPVLTTISPVSANAGSSAIAITVTGQQFISSSVVQWNGTALTTTFVSNSSLMAQVPASDLAAAGTAAVTVFTPQPGGGTSSRVSFSIVATNPAPTLTLLLPTSTVVGSPAFTLTLVGTGFISSSQVLWNGSALTTTYSSSRSLTAQVPASALTAAGTASVSVQNPVPGGGTSGALTFTIQAAAATVSVLDIEGNDIVWDAQAGKLYVSVPAAATSNGNTITVVDPIKGTIVSSQALSSEPSVLAISDDSQFLYAGVSGGSTVQRFKLPALTPDVQINLGGNTLYDMKVQPGAAHTLAVASSPSFPSPILQIFDDTTVRIKSDLLGSYNSIQWKADGTEVWGEDFSSDNALVRGSVSADGASRIASYRNAFRRFGTHLHSDPNTGYVYGDFGMAVDTATGLRVGNFAPLQADAGVYSTPMLAVDSTLKRAFGMREVKLSSSEDGYKVQSFDLTTYKEISEILIPNAVGTLANFVRWGNSGLAILTKAHFGVPGKLYLVDGAFVNPGEAAETSVGTPVIPVPILSTVSPMHAIAGSAGVSLTVTGHDFNTQTSLYWNGTNVPAAVISNTQMEAQIPAGYLTASALVSLTASNAAGMVSDSLQFAVDPALPSGTVMDVYNSGGNDAVWDATAQKLYVSLPGGQGDYGNTISLVDPVAHTEATQGFLGSDPDQLSISLDGKLLYAGFDGNGTVTQYDLPGFTVNRSWNLGFDETGGLGATYAFDLQAAPGAPHTTAISRAAFDVSPNVVGVTIFDDAVARPSKLTTGAHSYAGLQWAQTAATLYAEEQAEPTNFYTLGVNSSGVTFSNKVDDLVSPYSALHFDAGTGLIYTNGGQVIDPVKGTTVGNYTSDYLYSVTGEAVPDTAQNRVFMIGQTTAQKSTSAFTLEAYDEKGFNLVSSLTIQNVVGTPTALIRWGTNGLAITTTVGSPAFFGGIGPGRLYVITGAFVNPAVPASASSPTRFIE